MTSILKTESHSDATSALPKATAVTAGQLLREARLKSGMHLGVLSVTLKVPIRQLEAFEADALDPAKGPVFYRGLASSMCRHLRTDAAPILALLPQSNDQLLSFPKAIDPLESQASLGVASLPWGRLMSSQVFWGAGVMLFLTGALLWLPGPAHWTWLDDVKSLIADETASQVGNEPASSEAAVVLGSSLPSANATAAQAVMSAGALASGAPTLSDATNSPNTSNSAKAAVTAPIASSTPLPPPARVAVSPPPLAPGRSGLSPELVFSASSDSWLEVRNAQKVVIWSGVVKPGESTRIQSPLPLSVVVGRAQVVTVTVRGQPFDLKPHTQVTVARFELKE